MFWRIPIILFLSLIIASCGGAAPAEEPALTSQDVTSEPTAQPTIFESTPIAEPTSTLVPTATEVLPTPTETSLPPLELPALLPNAPSLLAWDGTPTYLGDSQPGFDFRVMYDPDLWALTPDQFGYPAIAHRSIPYCVISVTSGRGLPANISVEHDFLYAGSITFSVGTAYENGEKKFVTYTGGDGIIITGFEVVFEEQTNECLADAEMVITTLRSIPTSLATPEP
ncbi:MAG TPA: hypothetical protein DCX53_08030 [Anaerolineae bacterium]|nr:hypothetical protein [Anaerolineae bacterium]